MRSLFVAGSIILFYSNFEKLNVDRNGTIVKMRIESLPTSCIGAKMRYFVSFSYKGKVFDKAIRGDFCSKHHVGEMIDIKWLKGSKYILWPHESEITNLVSFVILGAFGLFISALQWKKMKKLKVSQ